MTSEMRMLANLDFTHQPIVSADLGLVVTSVSKMPI
jgi:hypothetical protein